MTTLANLYDHIGSNKPRPVLHCLQCDADYSANKGDYWLYPQDYVFTCCEEPLTLAYKQTQYTLQP